MMRQPDAKPTVSTGKANQPEGGPPADHQLHAPTLALPKGGGGIRGIDEKFSVNAFNGTAGFSLPLPLSPARALTPTLALGYNAGAGNGAFGLGWQVDMPAITRKTARGLPRYLDDGPESDVFLYAGAEDLVPALAVDATGEWQRSETAAGQHIARYRPRVESDFARIERLSEPGEVAPYWRVTTRDNVTHVFGRSAACRLADPQDATRVFSWLLERSYDDRGNCAEYAYKPEDTTGVAATAPEQPRLSGAAPCTNRYLKRVRYGNRHPYVADAAAPDPGFLFEVVFDYGEHVTEAPTPAEATPWVCRADPFSDYRAGFEVRTYRLCQRVLVFHHFTELGKAPCLVRSLDFRYAADPALTLLTGITQTGYQRQPDGGYSQKSLPPCEFDYQPLAWSEEVRTIAAEDAWQAPVGLASPQYQWTDLYGEGLAGLLAEQDRAWHYKRNLGGGHFAAATLVAPKPSLAGLATGELRLHDLEGNGRTCAVSYEPGAPGYFELSENDEWLPFQPFGQLPNLDWQRAGWKAVDLSGDGRADLLVDDGTGFTWYAAQGKAGYAAGQHVARPPGEEAGPAIIFADRDQTLVLADMSGDGLTDLVRIRNGEVVYWPNLGYGRFGARVTMSDAPVFAPPDQFHARYLRLADLDGSGPTDLLYVGGGAVSTWLNQAGNGWSAPRTVAFPPVDSATEVAVVDLLGTGTACLVWSSPLPHAQPAPWRYVDLLAGQKPHLLTAYRNNLGREVRLQHAASTRYYLADQLAGTPWATRLPFPVQCVAQVEVLDGVSGTRLVQHYRYHHGCYDYHEREFRGFGRVDQLDSETFAHFAGHGASNAVEEPLHQPPVETRTWFHTGTAPADQSSPLGQFAHEYYRPSGSPADLLPELTLPVALSTYPYYQPAGPPGDLLPTPDLPATLSAPEWLEAIRAGKGTLLRQEVYGRDDSAAADHPYSVTQRASVVHWLQPRAGNAHAVFRVQERESLTCHYERQPADPRVAHSLTLATDPYGHVLQSAAVVYPRRQPDPNLPPTARQAQGQLHVVYTEAAYTHDLIGPTAYRLRLPCETRTYELTGLAPALGRFSPAELQAAAGQAAFLAYEDETDGSRQKRLVENTRTTYLRADLAGPLPLGQLATHALPYETYALAFTPSLLARRYGDLTQQFGYAVDAATLAAGGYVQLPGSADWWLPSGTSLYPADAAGHFYLPRDVRDPFGHETHLTYDAYDLLLTGTRDALGNETATQPDYRVLAPAQLTDPNGNRTAVATDELGLVVRTAIMGKAGAGEGDTLADPTTELAYDLEQWRTAGRPAYVHTRAREQHGAANPRWQETYAYSDGGGQVVLTKHQAEPGLARQVDAAGQVTEVDTAPASRWVGTGRTMLNNKGKPVKQYEPYFSTHPGYEAEREVRELGVTPVLRYDPLGRLVRTDQPDGSFAQVAFDAWRQQTWDANDTVLLSRWYQERQASAEPADQQAAQQAAVHADTPATVHFDSLGRAVLAVAHNRSQRRNETIEEDFYGTWTEYDIEGKPLRVTDARGNVVMAWDYDLLGQLCRQRSMDAGMRWLLGDVAGRPLHLWDSRGQQTSHRYDALHRPLALIVQATNGSPRTAEQYEYGESQPDPQSRNLRGQLYRHFDPASVIVHDAYDFKGNLLQAHRQLLLDYKTPPDWAGQPALAAETFGNQTAYDALNRPVRTVQPDQSVFLPTYNEANQLRAVAVQLRGQGAPTAFVTGISYDAKGQRQRISYGNGTTTRYDYDPATYRLTRLLTTADQGTRLLQDLRYTYDPVGNLTRQLDAAQPTVFFGGQQVSAQSRYWYDALYRLVEAEGREHPGQVGFGSQDNWGDQWCRLALQPNSPVQLRTYAQKYAYDAVGNIAWLRHLAGPQGSWTRTYAYRPNNNQLVTTQVGSQTYAYAYNAHGSMAALPHLPALAWTFREELQTVDLGGGGRAWYVYDGSGQRIRKVVERPGGRTEERLYLGGVELYRERTTDTLTLTRETLHVLDDQRRIALIETRTAGQDGSLPQLIRYQYDNHLGSACLELDETARVISYEEYHPYGTTAYQATDATRQVPAKRYRYTGLERDEESGFGYHAARYYLPWLGRWASADPVGIEDGVNVYAFCRNNPLVFVDPEGTEIIVSANSAVVSGNSQISIETSQADANQVFLRDIRAGLSAQEAALLQINSNNRLVFSGQRDDPSKNSELLQMIVRQIDSATKITVAPSALGFPKKPDQLDSISIGNIFDVSLGVGSSKTAVQGLVLETSQGGMGKSIFGSTVKVGNEVALAYITSKNATPRKGNMDRAGSSTKLQDSQRQIYFMQGGIMQTLVHELAAHVEGILQNQPNEDAHLSIEMRKNGGSAVGVDVNDILKHSSLAPFERSLNLEKAAWINLRDKVILPGQENKPIEKRKLAFPIGGDEKATRRQNIVDFLRKVLNRQASLAQHPATP